MSEIEKLECLLSSIHNIIFDLGGVIYNLDYSRTQKEFEKLGLEEFGKIYSQAAQTGLFDLYEKGLIDTDMFRNQLRTFVPDISLSDSAIDKAWNAMLLDLPSWRLDIISSLRPRFRTFLLSNTNDLHLNAAYIELREVAKVNSFSHFFEQAYFSNKLHLRKPDADIFCYVLIKNGLKPAETLFIDDTARHVESAKKLGIKGLHIGGDVSLEDLYVTLHKYARH